MTDSVDYQVVVADLKARRAQLDQLIASVEALILGQGEPGAGKLDMAATGATVLPTAIHADTFYGLSIIDAAKKFLKMARRAQHTAAIADAIGKGGLKQPDINVLSSILVRAAKGREVTKVGKGMWGLAEWYPKPPKEPVEERRKPRKTGRPTAKAKKVTAPEKKVKPKATRTRTPRASKEGTAQQSGARPSDIAVEVMRAAGKPLHAVEITKRVNDRGVTAARLPIESFLNRQAKAGKMQKVGPSTFALAG
jgi:hypothetical protein